MADAGGKPERAQDLAEDELVERSEVPRTRVELESKQNGHSKQPRAKRRRKHRQVTEQHRAAAHPADVAVWRADNWFKLVKTAIRTVGVLGAFGFLWLIIHELAGKTTTFNGVASILLQLSADRWVAYCIAGLSGAGWYAERSLRKKTISDQS